MAFIHLPDGIKIEIKMRKNGAPVVNVEWGVITVGIDLPTLETVAQAVVAWWNSNMKNLVTASLALESVTVTDWTVPNGIQHVETLLIPSAGTATGDDMPSNVASVVTFYTGFTGRSNRGRVYNGGLAALHINGNTLVTSYVTAMLTAWADFKVDMAAVNVEHVVASFYTAGAPRAVGVANQVIEYGMNNVVDTQRRRIPRVDN